MPKLHIYAILILIKLLLEVIVWQNYQTLPETKIQMDKKKLLVIFLLVLAAMVVAGFYLYNDQKPFGSDTEEVPFSIERTELPGTQFPKAIPTDLPVEGGSRVLENSETIASDGRVQSTVVLTTEKTVANSLNEYLRFFESKNWLNIEELQTQSATSAMAVMQYQDNRLSIEVKAGSNNSPNTIKITLLEAVSINN